MEKNKNQDLSKICPKWEKGWQQEEALQDIGR
jgi:hypothetical protein